MEGVNADVARAGRGVGGMEGADGSRISFAPGTTFLEKARARSKHAASVKVPAALHLRPGTSEDPHRRFKLPKATLPSLHYLSVSQEDFLDPRYAVNIVKTYGIPKYFFKSKSNLLLSAGSRTRSRKQHNSNNSQNDVVVTSSVAPTNHIISSDDDNRKQQKQQQQRQQDALERDADDVRPMTSEAVPTMTRPSNRLPIVVPIAGTTGPEGGNQQRQWSHNSRPTTRGGAGEMVGGEGGGGGSSHPQAAPQMPSVYRPLIGEKYTQARFCPPMNPFRSLQMESEVTKYVEHKKRVGLGKYVSSAESATALPPTSAMTREASMYDLNNQGPAERPLDRYLPPPDRRLCSRQRPRGDLKNDLQRPSDDHDLAIVPRDRTAAERSSVILKDMVRR